MKRLTLLLLLFVLAVQSVYAKDAIVPQVYIPIVSSVPHKAVDVGRRLMYLDTGETLRIRGSYVALDLFEPEYDAWRLLQYGIIIHNGHHNTIVVYQPQRPLQETVDLIAEANSHSLHVMVISPTFNLIHNAKHLDVSWLTDNCSGITTVDPQSPVFTNDYNNSCGAGWITGDLNAAVPTKPIEQIALYKGPLVDDWCWVMSSLLVQGSFWYVEDSETNWLWSENTAVIPLCP